jgi:hypothetical protein
MAPEIHFPNRDTDGLRHRMTCTCGFKTPYFEHKEASEEAWAKHAMSAIRRVTRPKYFIPQGAKSHDC